jgi:hypothetical protein
MKRVMKKKVTKEISITTRRFEISVFIMARFASPPAFTKTIPISLL